LHPLHQFSHFIPHQEFRSRVGVVVEDTLQSLTFAPTPAKKQMHPSTASLDVAVFHDQGRGVKHPLRTSLCLLSFFSLFFFFFCRRITGQMHQQQQQQQQPSCAHNLPVEVVAYLLSWTGRRAGF
jgi:hypothetical protein